MAELFKSLLVLSFKQKDINMTPTEWAGLIVAVITIIAGFAGAVRWLVKHYLYELRPNGGSSLKDKIDLLEEKVELLTELIKEALRK